jgi:hypothetical protein
LNGVAENLRHVVAFIVLSGEVAGRRGERPPQPLPFRGRDNALLAKFCTNLSIQFSDFLLLAKRSLFKFQLLLPKLSQLVAFVEFSNQAS